MGWSIQAADLIRARTKETYCSIADGDIMLTFVRNVWIFRYGLSTLNVSGKKENKFLAAKKGRKGYGQHNFASACFGLLKRRGLIL